MASTRRAYWRSRSSVSTRPCSSPRPPPCQQPRIIRPCTSPRPPPCQQPRIIRPCSGTRHFSSCPPPGRLLAHHPPDAKRPPLPRPARPAPLLHPQPHLVCCGFALEPHGQVRPEHPGLQSLHLRRCGRRRMPHQQAHAASLPHQQAHAASLRSCPRRPPPPCTVPSMSSGADWQQQAAFSLPLPPPAPSCPLLPPLPPPGAPPPPGHTRPHLATNVGLALQQVAIVHDLASGLVLVGAHNVALERLPATRDSRRLLGHATACMTKRRHTPARRGRTRTHSTGAWVTANIALSSSERATPAP